MPTRPRWVVVLVSAVRELDIQSWSWYAENERWDVVMLAMFVDDEK